MKGVGDIYFITLEPTGGVHPHTDFSFFSMFFTARISEAAIGGAGIGGHDKYDSKRAALELEFSLGSST
jgi:hypothetical protein